MNPLVPHPVPPRRTINWCMAAARVRAAAGWRSETGPGSISTMLLSVPNSIWKAKVIRSCRSVPGSGGDSATMSGRA